MRNDTLSALGRCTRNVVSSSRPSPFGLNGFGVTDAITGRSGAGSSGGGAAGVREFDGVESALVPALLVAETAHA